MKAIAILLLGGGIVLALYGVALKAALLLFAAMVASKIAKD